MVSLGPRSLRIDARRRAVTAPSFLLAPSMLTVRAHHYVIAVEVIPGTGDCLAVPARAVL